MLVLLLTGFRLVKSVKQLEQQMAEAVRDARKIIEEAETVTGCIESTDIWGKPSVIVKGARLLARLITLVDANEE